VINHDKLLKSVIASVSLFGMTWAIVNLMQHETDIWEYVDTICASHHVYVGLNENIVMLIKFVTDQTKVVAASSLCLGDLGLVDRGKLSTVRIIHGRKFQSIHPH
jgi:hypothetical protein